MSIIENKIQYFFSRLPLFLLLCRGYILGKPFPVVRRVLTNRGLARQSVFTAIETMNGQTFGKREMGKTVGKE